LETFIDEDMFNFASNKIHMIRNHSPFENGVQFPH